jgi:hypothetical protein
VAKLKLKRSNKKKIPPKNTNDEDEEKRTRKPKKDITDLHPLFFQI